MSGLLSGIRSIALSYGTMIQDIPTTFHDPAFKLSSRIITHLLNNWRVGVLYSINIPMIDKLLHDDGLKIYWTSVWKSNYGRLFAEVPGLAGGDASGKVEGIDLQTTDTSVPLEGDGHSRYVAEEESLVFRFHPDFTGLLEKTAAPEGSDGWALDQGAVSVTPFLPSFAELPESEHGFTSLQEREWKLKL